MIAIEKQGAVDVLSLQMPLEKEIAEELIGSVERCANGRQPAMVLDLSGTPLIDGAGLESLLESRDLARRRGGVLKIAGALPLCQDILRVTGVSDHFESFPDATSAVGSFSR